MAPPTRTVAGLIALGLGVGLGMGAGACGGGAPQVAKDVTPPRGRGDARDSLFRAANLGRALARVRRRVGAAGSVTSFKLEAGAVTLLVQRGPAPESVVVTKDLALTHVPAPPAAEQPPIPLSQIDPAAPERIAAAIGQRTGAGLRDIDFFAVDREPGAANPRWLAYLRHGRGTFAAGLSGADVRPVSETVTATTPAPAATSTPSATPAPGTSTTTTPKPASGGGHRKPPNCLRLRPPERLRTPGCAAAPRR